MRWKKGVEKDDRTCFAMRELEMECVIKEITCDVFTKSVMSLLYTLCWKERIVMFLHLDKVCLYMARDQIQVILQNQRV